MIVHVSAIWWLALTINVKLLYSIMHGAYVLGSELLIACIIGKFKETVIID